jgi:hypothetical protein
LALVFVAVPLSFKNCFLFSIFEEALDLGAKFEANLNKFRGIYGDF